MEFILGSAGKLYFDARGIAEGTNYNVIYQDDEERNFQPDIETLLIEFEKSLSIYDENSIISRINRNEDVEVDDYFVSVFQRAKEISEQTGGIFDMSAEPLFRAWGFSSIKDKRPLSKDDLSNIRQYVGMDKVWLEGRKVVKSNPNVVLSANAIAKGYSTDIVAGYLEEKGVKNYLVEIGGEIRVKGVNSDNRTWRIGVDRPYDDNHNPGQDIQVLLQLTDKAIATSGNYRQFYIENGQKITHTIDPRTGCPINHNLLSVTVVADDALTADAFATVFLVAGVEESKQMLESLPAIEALFIYDEDNHYKVYNSAGIQHYIVQQ